MNRKDILNRIKEIEEVLQRDPVVEPLQPLMTPELKTKQELEETKKLSEELEELYRKLAEETSKEYHDSEDS